MFVRACIFQRLWSSGRIPRCHRGDPGSIPGKRTFDLSIRYANIIGGSIDTIIVLGQKLSLNRCSARLRWRDHINQGVPCQVL